MGIATTRWDITEHLDTPEAIAAYLEVVFEEGDPAEVRRALGHVARAQGMTEVAAKAGITRPGLYKALSETGNPSFDTVAAITRALGVKLAVRSSELGASDQAQATSSDFAVLGKAQIRVFGKASARGKAAVE